MEDPATESSDRYSLVPYKEGDPTSQSVLHEADISGGPTSQSVPHHEADNSGGPASQSVPHHEADNSGGPASQSVPHHEADNSGGPTSQSVPHHEADNSGGPASQSVPHEAGGCTSQLDIDDPISQLIPHEDDSGDPTSHIACSTAVVKMGSDSYFLDLEAACNAYLSRNCMEWQKLERAFFFPPVFPVRYVAPIGQASGAVRLSKSEEQDIKGDEAELKLFHCLEKFCHEKPMFVLAKFEFGDFVKNVLARAARGATLQVEHTLPPLEELFDLSGEADFLVVHRNAGILLFEVKAVEKFRPARYQDAKKQLDIAAEHFIQPLLDLKQLSKVVPVYKVVAFPNVTTPGKSSGGYIDLRHHDLEGQECIEKWWCNHFPKQQLSTDQERALLQLVGLLVGQRASLCAYASILADVFSTIDSQSFLARAFQKQQRKYQRGSAATPPTPITQGITKIRDEPQLSVLTHQFVFLNPEQLSIWEGPKRQFLTGVTGSGKTILVQHKALECAQRGDQVLILVPSPLDLLYKQFFSENAQGPEIVQVIDFDSLPKFMSKPKLNLSLQVHIFSDEFQVLISNPCGDQLLNFAEFGRFLAKHQHHGCYLWFCYDNIQTQNELMETDNYDRWAEFDSFKSDICKDLGFVHAQPLATAMRYTKEVYDFLSTRQPYRRVEGMPSLQRGLTDLENPSIYLGHNVTGPQVLVQVLPGESMDEYFFFASHFIIKELEEWATTEGQRDYSKLAVLTEREEDVTTLCQQLNSKDIPVCGIGEKINAVTVDWGIRARSFEWLVVVAFCSPEAIKYHTLLISRAVVRLLFLEVSYS